MEKKKESITKKKPETKKTIAKKSNNKKTIKKTNTRKNTKKKSKAFTLIELLAVIIILGILMIIAIPSVTTYISNSRKSSYIDTAKNVVSGARNIANEGKLGMYDTNTTYYIPASYIKTENSLKSPYGDFTEAYIGVIFDGKGYNYFWISNDTSGQGVNKVTSVDLLSEDDIVAGIKDIDIIETVSTTGLDGRKTIKVLENGVWVTKTENATNNISSDGKIQFTITGRLIEWKDETINYNIPFEEGMTWKDLIESGYEIDPEERNRFGYEESIESVYAGISRYGGCGSFTIDNFNVVYYNGNKVQLNDPIIAGATYTADWWSWKHIIATDEYIDPYPGLGLC